MLSLSYSYAVMSSLCFSPLSNCFAGVSLVGAIRFNRKGCVESKYGPHRCCLLAKAGFIITCAVQLLRKYRMEMLYTQPYHVRSVPGQTNYKRSPKKNKSYDRQGIQKVHGETQQVRIGLPMSD